MGKPTCLQREVFSYYNSSETDFENTGEAAFLNGLSNIAGKRGIKITGRADLIQKQLEGNYEFLSDSGKIYASGLLNTLQNHILKNKKRIKNASAAFYNLEEMKSNYSYSFLPRDYLRSAKFNISPVADSKLESTVEDTVQSIIEPTVRESSPEEDPTPVFYQGRAINPEGLGTKITNWIEAIKDCFGGEGGYQAFRKKRAGAALIVPRFSRETVKKAAYLVGVAVVGAIASHYITAHYANKKIEAKEKMIVEQQNEISSLNGEMDVLVGLNQDLQGELQSSEAMRDKAIKDGVGYEVQAAQAKEEASNCAKKNEELQDSLTAARAAAQKVQKQKTEIEKLDNNASQVYFNNYFLAGGSFSSYSPTDPNSGLGDPNNSLSDPNSESGPAYSYRKPYEWTSMVGQKNNKNFKKGPLEAVVGVLGLAYQAGAAVNETITFGATHVNGWSGGALALGAKVTGINKEASWQEGVNDGQMGAKRFGAYAIFGEECTENVDSEIVAGVVNTATLQFKKAGKNFGDAITDGVRKEKTCLNQVTAYTSWLVTHILPPFLRFGGDGGSSHASDGGIEIIEGEVQ